MSSEHQQLADDLSKHAARELQEVLNRHFHVIQDVLPPADCGMVLLNIANGVALGTTLYALQVAKDEVSEEQIWELIATTLPKLLEAGKPAVMAALKKQRSAA